MSEESHEEARRRGDEKIAEAIKTVGYWLEELEMELGCTLDDHPSLLVLHNRIKALHVLRAYAPLRRNQKEGDTAS